MWRFGVAVAVFLTLIIQCYPQPDAECPFGCICNSDLLAVHCFAQANLRTVPNFHTGTRTIFIRGSNLGEITDDTFRNFTNLQWLQISGNRVTSVSYSAFVNNKKLKYLDIGNNAISEIHPGTFRNQELLSTLKLNNNQLDSLEKEMFSGLDRLRILTIENNRIKRLTFSAMDSLPELALLKLGGNLFECNCEIAWVKGYPPVMNRGPSLDCSFPNSSLAQDITDLTYTQLGCDAPSVTPLRDTVQAHGGDLGVELHCEVKGDPTPEIQWLWEGVELTEFSHVRLPENGSVVIALMIPALAGQYVCTASSFVGSASATIHLEYAGLHPPVIHTAPSNTHAFAGSSFTLLCEAYMVADETFQWLKDGQLLSSSAGVVYSGMGQNLTVLNAERSDSGNYTCVVSNAEGSTNVSAMVQVTSTVLTCDGLFSPGVMEALRERVDRAFNRTQQELQQPPSSPGSLLRRLRFPDSGIIEHLKAAEIFDQAVSMLRRELLNGSSVLPGTDIPDLSECELEVLGTLSGCQEHQRVADCSDCLHQKYRTIDGSCNNLDHPLQGASEVPFIRLLEPAYEDKVGLPVGWTDTSKPSPRVVSLELIATKEVTNDEQFTLMLMQFGQFLDHDLDLAPSSPSDIVFDITDTTELSSCDDTCNNDSPCFPIPIPEDDPRIEAQCMSFTRSSAVCGTGAASLLVGHRSIYREQLNAITSYMDGSMIYGSTDHVAERLRAGGENGKLREGTPTASGMKLLPFDNESLIECSTGIHANRSECFLAGDVRTNEQVGLTSMHTMFYREHNRVVNSLASLNPHWDGEKLYQEARKIVIAVWQHIVYNEYLPKILGTNFLGEYKGYNASVDATIANSFATAAYRFGHSQIMPFFQRLDSDYEPLAVGPLRLQDAFFAPFRIVEEGGIEPLVRGLLASPVKMRVSHQGLNNNLTEALFAQAHQIALDLAALNIQRGRDHGLPSYTKWRAFCGLSVPNTMDELSEVITNSTIVDLFSEVYGDDPDNIDLWVGGLLEEPMPGSVLGPTFHCIIGDQFRRLRDGDRFFYERPGQFSPDQLVQIKQASLSRVICDNTDDIERVPVDAFILQESSEFVSCDDLPTVDLMLWKECGECAGDSPVRAKRSALFKSHTKDYQTLFSKIVELEEKIGVCRFNGTAYGSGESWRLSDTFKCSCQNGDMQCEEQT